MMKYILILLITLSTQASLFKEGLTVPDDQMNLLVLQDNKKLVKSTIKLFKKTFRKEALKRGGLISVNDVWWSKTFNAYAMKYGPMWRITIHGGLLKHQSLTQDVLSLVICHELGHFLGGAPKFSSFGKKFSSYEGQADFWTGQRCLKRIFGKDDNISITNEMNIHPLAIQECDAVYEKKTEKALCYRVVNAGLDMGKLVSEVTGKPQANLDTPDGTVVDVTYKDHPNFQCRVDTYFQSALCPITENISDTDVSKGSCYSQFIGSRPNCWFSKH